MDRTRSFRASGSIPLRPYQVHDLLSEQRLSGAAPQPTSVMLDPRGCRRTCRVCAATCASEHDFDYFRVTKACMNRRRPSCLGSRDALRLDVDDPLWYKDAVIYQLTSKAFLDSNDDGSVIFQA